MIASTTVSATHIIASTTASSTMIASTAAHTSVIANIWTLLSKIELKDILSILATLVAAFAGAGFAFLLEDRANKEQERKNQEAAQRQEIKNQIAAGNKAMFTLIRQWNTLFIIKRDIIDPARTKPNIHLHMRPLLPLEYAHLIYDFDSLSFLLETKYRNCMTSLYIAESQFQQTIQILNERSNIHREIAQPLWEKAGTPLTASTKEIDDILGIRISARLEGLTKHSIQYIDETIPFLEKTRDELVLALSELYPEEKAKIIKFENINKQNKTPTPSP